MKSWPAFDGTGIFVATQSWDLMVFCGTPPLFFTAENDTFGLIIYLLMIYLLKIVISTAI
jgi:hypothetical protein